MQVIKQFVQYSTVMIARAECDGMVMICTEIEFGIWYADRLLRVLLYTVFASSRR
jgi:hypothetical protein